jgi:hypothetical protein
MSQQECKTDMVTAMKKEDDHAGKIGWYGGFNIRYTLNRLMEKRLKDEDLKEMKILLNSTAARKEECDCGEGGEEEDDGMVLSIGEADFFGDDLTAEEEARKRARHSIPHPDYATQVLNKHVHKWTHMLTCRVCGDFGWYENIADGDTGYTLYGTCGVCDPGEEEKELEEKEKEIGIGMVGDNERKFFIQFTKELESEVSVLRKKVEELTEWKTNMKLFNGTNGIDSDDSDDDSDEV